MKLKKQLGDEILAYCKLNNIEDTSAFLNKIVETGFNLEKYGSSPKKSSEVKTIDTNISPEIQKHMDALEAAKEQAAREMTIPLPSGGKYYSGKNQNLDKVTLKPLKPNPKEDDYDIYDY